MCLFHFSSSWRQACLSAACSTLNFFFFFFLRHVLLQNHVESISSPIALRKIEKMSAFKQATCNHYDLNCLLSRFSLWKIHQIFFQPTCDAYTHLWHLDLTCTLGFFTCTSTHSQFAHLHKAAGMYNFEYFDCLKESWILALNCWLFRTTTYIKSIQLVSQVDLDVTIELRNNYEKYCI